MMRIAFIFCIFLSTANLWAKPQDKGLDLEIQKIEKQSSKSVKDYMTLGELYLKNKNYKEAIKIFRKANNPQSVQALDKLSIALHLNKEYLEEIRALEIIKADHKISPSQHTRLADAYSEIDKIPEALENYRGAIQKAPKYEKAYLGIYKLYLKKENYYDARLVILEALEKLKANKFWMNEYCKVEILEKYFDNAKKVCQTAISIDSSSADNHVYLAVAYQHTENETQARKILDQAEKQFKNSELVQWSAAQINEEIKNWEQSERQYRQCIKADSKSGRCYLGLGKVLFQQQKYQEALRFFQKSCPYLKGVDVEIRKYSYELEKKKEKSLSKEYSNEISKCELSWYNSAKKIEK